MFRKTPILVLCFAAFANVASAETIVIPVRLIDGNNVADTLIGNTSVRLHLDTGGYKTLGLFPRALRKLSVVYIGKSATRIDGYGAESAGREFTVPALRIGNHLLRNVGGYERTAASGDTEFDDVPFDGVIGRDFLNQYVTVIDYPNRRVELHAPRAGHHTCGTPTAVLNQRSEGFLTSNVTTDHGTFEFIWDTGAKGASFIQQRIVNQKQITLVDDAYRTQRFLVGSRDLGVTELVPLTLDGIRNFDGLFGISVFSRFRVCFDIAHRSVSIR